jgi:hypothetical protein
MLSIRSGLSTVRKSPVQSEHSFHAGCSLREISGDQPFSGMFLPCQYYQPIGNSKKIFAKNTIFLKFSQ